MGDNEAQLNMMNYVVMREIQPDIITHTRTDKDGHLYVEMEAVQRMVTKTAPPPTPPYSIQASTGAYQTVSKTYTEPSIRKYRYAGYDEYTEKEFLPAVHRAKERRKKIREECIKNIKFARRFSIIGMLFAAVSFDIYLFQLQFTKLIVPGVCIVINMSLFMFQNHLINKEENNEIY